MQTIVVEGKSCRVFKTVDVLWSGWDCDSRAWLVLDEEQFKLVGSNHGTKVFIGRDWLEERVSTYEETLSATKHLLDVYDQLVEE